jgi:VanZ family protein
VEERGQDPSKVVLTVSDADSDFHKRYFDSLSQSYADTAKEKRDLTLWQSPIFHVKNYHRQPMPLIVGTMFTAMAEISVLSDPNSVRFPYSTYSLSMNLAKHVGGWDPEWIAEDWHMGIKCFLLTLGESQIQPILLPTVNYMPEDDSWLGTCYARWAQAKRHALGFSDMAYYFMMLPLIFAQLSKPRKDGKDLRHFWKLFFNGLAYVVRLVNTHVIVGIMTLYMAMSCMLKNIMILILQDGRNVGELFARSKGACSMFMFASFCTMAITTLNFQVVYSTLKDRMAPPKPRYEKMFDSWLAHWLYTLFACIFFAMVYAVGLGAAVWIAAVKVLCLKSFAYEVAAKPTAEKHL